MTNHEFKMIRVGLGITQAELARVLRHTLPLTISTYERETNPRPIPKHVALLMIAYRDGYRPTDWPVS
jgi:DNA-binding XRE family transcriptional regulator